jgi:hypothetical protein
VNFNAESIGARRRFAFCLKKSLKKGKNVQLFCGNSFPTRLHFADAEFGWADAAKDNEKNGRGMRANKIGKKL